MSDAPSWWYRPGGVAAWALSPFSAIFGHIGAMRMAAPPKAVSRLPVLCVGNFVAGGAGKTPTAIAIAKQVRAMGLRPGFLSRGYGSNAKGAVLVDVKVHNSRDVGDEPMILALYATTVVCADRVAGAALLQSCDVDFIIMDDGFQNPTLRKDMNVVVVDGGRGVGNGFPMPSGPLRATLAKQMTMADRILLIGSGAASGDVVRRAARMAKPIMQADIAVRQGERFDGSKVMAFCGLADPEKFFATLKALGADVVEEQAFGDHHAYSAGECRELMSRASELGMPLVTTQKDEVRLVRAGEAQAELRKAIDVLVIDLLFETERTVTSLIEDTRKRAATYRLKNPANIADAAQPES
ncbi:tetraacyldisaccharide 4'-kinase [Ahrensia sp. R2A130]|uniref:tetraacyldisaccharide 4'-kinase n=1 Tax=Ahrensia sp. R2A130 TaxID=744979 RepID=UPI0001E09C53|nr:tetraacyldisaccharide 4'-kinase [Ahrensia sp. R2A130]EFL88574.1 tetraacyldisaccharide 4'-kinase [Ahrensia sp. R2A130]